MNNFDTIEHLKETILKEYDHLNEDDGFKFECKPGISCFNDCCGDVNIFLTPYDVLRMSRGLRMSTSEFLIKYTIIPFDKNQNIPIPLLLMKETEKKECHFVDPEKGCAIYDNRPWPCRMYPLGLASPDEEKTGQNKFYFLIEEDHCHGFKEEKSWKIKGWLENQGVKKYDEFGEYFKDITIHPKFSRGWKPTSKHIEIYWMALYHLDKFRAMVFESSFLERFEFSDQEKKDIQESDEELLKLGFKWVKMALFGENTLKIQPEAAENVKKQAKPL